MLLTWEEDRLARAEVQHLVDVYEAEIVPLILWHERLHYQPVEHAVFPRLKAFGCPRIPRKGGPGKGRDEDDEAKGPSLVLVDPVYATVLVAALTPQIQSLSHLGLCGAANLHLIPLAMDPRAACGRGIVRITQEEPCPLRTNLIACPWGVKSNAKGGP